MAGCFTSSSGYAKHLNANRKNPEPPARGLRTVMKETIWPVFSEEPNLRSHMAQTITGPLGQQVSNGALQHRSEGRDSRAIRTQKANMRRSFFGVFSIEIALEKKTAWRHIRSVREFHHQTFSGT